MMQLLQTIARVRRQINPKLTIDGVLVTMVDNRTNFAKDISFILRRDYGDKLGAKLLYCYLLDMAGGRHHSVVISIKSLGKSVGLFRSATSRNLNRLRRRLGMIGIVPRYSEDGGRLSNQYLMK
jgi:cellulose biosynthesis protein BcsQ